MLRRYTLSLAQVESVGIKRVPGYISFMTLVTGSTTLEVSTDAGLSIGGASCESFNAGSAASSSNFAWISSGDSFGKMRQLIVARAICGKAFSAWPPEISVGTHVVRSIALYTSLALETRSTTFGS